MNELEDIFNQLEDERIKLGLCWYCGGSGDIPEAGMFSRRYKCDKCKGTGKSPDKSGDASHREP